ncbi:putative membrane protein [Asticcacaulis biprosthecium C19]|uniref:Putative membrane protein n=1 Tax=Asticcacaulis biprosthecium C19 TaxID=715226 RepID=F4QHJ4_9CAUL|nr:hypothetical protein [Asticcacaulis biprosthecium]EGF92731.1 putative membrane protein [Asticcacaulis biprosthecium C19]
MPLLYLAAAFYLLTGLYAARLLMRYESLDVALDLIEGKQRPFWSRYQTAYLTAGSLVIALSGLFSLFRLDLALYAALFAVAQQAAYFYYLAPRHMDPHDPPDPKGRRSSQNAYLGFCVFALALAWAFWAHHLRPVTALSPIEMMLAGGCGLAWIGYVVWLFLPRRWV